MPRLSLAPFGRAVVDLLLEERARWAYWTPVLLAFGIGLYFILPVEAPLGLGVTLCVAVFAFWLFLRRHSWLGYALLGVLCLPLGFTAAQVRSALVAAPMLDRQLGPTELRGTVIAREVTGEGARLLLEDIVIERLEAARTPVRIRLTLRGEENIPPIGAQITVLVNLLPPMEPSHPGGYDFRRDAFFDGIGAYAIALRAPVMSGEKGEAAWAEAWRERTAAQIAAAIPGPEGAIAIALMTGERASIDEQTNASMRDAGTAHLLSISGMHIGMVGGFVFFLLRALLALSARLALNYPIKRWAAVAALSAVVAYTWLVGAPIPALRATLMAALVFIAVVLDRQAITMRAVALAAGIILIIFPEALLNPGFQMSFAAIVMLVAGYEWWKQRDIAEQRQGLGWRAARYVGGIILTSLIAGFATMPYGAWHFHRIQLLGVLGNLIAVPLTGFIVMPAAVLAYPLLPFDLADPVLQLMGWGLLGVTRSAAWIASLPYAAITVGQFSLLSLLLISLGGLWLAIWQSRLRWAGVGLMAVGLLLAPHATAPAVLISPEGKIAVRAQVDGQLYVRRLPARGIVYEQWQLAFGASQPIRSWREEEVGMTCDKLGCVWQGTIALPNDPAALPDDCARADVVIVPELSLRRCAGAALIDRAALREHGAHMVMADGRILTQRSGSRRPWQPGFSYTSGSARPDGPVP
jgi:competence protein ComEC